MKRITCLMLAILLVLGATAFALSNAESMDRLAPSKQKVDDSQLIPEIVMPMAPYVKPDGGKAWYLQEGFEGAWLPAGWDTSRVSGTYANYLTRVTSGTYPTCTPHTGTYMVKYYCYLASAGNRIRFITPKVRITFVNDSLSFWMTHSTGYATANDRIVVEKMVKSGGVWGSWTAVDSFSRYQAAFSWARKALPLGMHVGDDSVRISLTCHSMYGDNIYMDDVAIGADFVPSQFDVMAQSIDTPATVIVPPSVQFQPSFSVKNNGTDKVPPFGTSCHIYDSTGADVWNFTAWPGDSIAPDSVLHFVIGVPFNPATLMRYQMVVYTELPGDGHPENDTLRFNFRTYDRNVGATAIVVPAGAYVHKDSTIAPRATFRNFATEPASFDAYFLIDFGGPVYYETAAIADLAPGADTTITFPDWIAPHDIGTHQVYAFSSQEWELNPANDTISKTITTSPIWQYVASVPDGGGAYTRWSYNGSCVSNGLLWLVAGRRDAGWAVLNNVGTYDPAANTWNDARPVVNQARVYLTAAGNDAYVFALGGRDGAGAVIYNNNERLDSPDGSAWTNMAGMPAGRVFGTSVCDDQYVYYLGGTSDAGATTPTTTLWRYDIAGDTWDQTLAQIPATMNSADATLMDGKIYILGDALNNTTCIYDIASDNWGTIDNATAGLPGASMYKAVAMYGKVWRIGGILSASNTSTNGVWELDPATEIWTDISKPMLQTRISFASGFINGTVVSAGGVAYPGFTPTMTAEAIDASYLGVAGRPAAVTAPGTFALYGNHPNPFRNATTISFQLSRAGRVNLAVYSVTGQLVRSLASETRPAGRHSVSWNGKDNGGRAVSSGIYFYRLSAGSNSATGKLVFVR